MSLQSPSASHVSRVDSIFSMLLGLVLVMALNGLAVPTARAAESDCTALSLDCVAVGQWNFGVELGAGVRTNPLANGKDIPLVLVPHVSYYGTRFFLDDLDIGFTLAENNATSLSLVASPGYDRVYFYRYDLQNFFINGFTGPIDEPAYTDNPANAEPGAIKVPPRPRYVTYLAGPEWTFKFRGVTGQLDALHEVTGHDHGDEVRAAITGPLLRARGDLTASIGLTWKSAAIVNYYYGVPQIYTGGSALDPFVKLAYIQPLARKWRLHAFGAVERLAGAITKSPIVAEHSVATVFVGVAYVF
jgi:outer membrane protein